MFVIIKIVIYNKFWLRNIGRGWERGARVGFSVPEHSAGANVRAVMQHAREGWCFLNWHETKQTASDRELRSET